MVLFIGLIVLGLVIGFAQWIDTAREPAWRVLLALMLGLAWLGAGAAGALIGLSGAMGRLDAISADAARAPGLDAPPPDVMRAILAGMPLLGWWLAGAALLSLLLLLPPVRRLLARVMPIDPERMVHVLALQLSLLVVVGSVFVAQFIGAVLNADHPAEAMRWLEAMNEKSSSLSGIWLQQLGFAALAMLGVGLIFVRGPRSTLDRLGLLGPIRWRWVGAAVAVGLLSGVLVSYVWKLWDPGSQAGVEKISEALFGPFIRTGLLGALTIGLSAGIGEETLFRGAMQPRFGIAYTSLLFAVIHTQYGVTPALLQVLALAVVLGVVRLRANTVTALLAHAIYNFILVSYAVMEAGIPWRGLPPGAPLPSTPTPAATEEASQPGAAPRLTLTYASSVQPSSGGSAAMRWSQPGSSNGGVLMIRASSPGPAGSVPG